ncbi:type I-E CRISPR-associated protein Cas6/Cse3/CasE [Ferrimonas marina]|uniref:CRISPR-associated protein Cas6/Cse3/CasE, subtype I-E/ECOLI n=1 Tax=Ferrimonas marina TaxID=299255 RepID=A0A1M5UCS5_9GAMM|nr:type I-E CRISPR-associated protein Cas6/Cse3/CasE [Ferrimonas marina]SHH60711.1 CRISPR-associated protein Cas6/Cse3/CasE, subtype I-E/ECOLI [Ferrimonas marina]
MYESHVITDIDSQDLYALHQETWRKFTGKDRPRRDAPKTPFLYWPMTSEGQKGTCLMIRSEQPSFVKDFSKKGVEFDPAVGDEVSFVIRLCLTSRAPVTNGKGQVVKKNRETDLEPEEISDWVGERMRARGMEVLSLKVRSLNKYNVKRHGYSFQGGELMLKVKVTDPVLAKQAYVNGIGRQKAFGFGMMVIVG